MKNRNRFLLILLSAALCAFAVFCASCSPKTVILSFETNGVTEVKKVVVEEGKSYVLPVPETEGYEFEGWYNDADFSGSKVEKVIAYTNAVFYAKFEKLVKITLDTDGGTVDGKNVVYVRKGKAISGALDGIVPAKKDCEFGCWIIDGSDTVLGNKKAEEDISLKARYKIRYTAEIYLQNITDDGYTRKETDYTGYDYVQKEYSPDYTEEHFTRTYNENEVTVKDLTENVSENVYKIYFDRNEYKLALRSNVDGVSDAEKSFRYGAEEYAPVPFAAEGKVLVGWAENKDGDVKYRTDFFNRENFLYNGGQENYAADKILIEDNTVLYAVWLDGLTAMLGGSDVIYIPDKGGESAYLERGDTFFKGKYDKENEEFYFKNVDKTLIEGKIISLTQYVYKNEERGVISAKLYEYDAAERKYKVNENESIVFDEYNGVTYKVKNSEGEISVENGEYTIEDTYFYHADFESGKKLVFIISTVKDQAGYVFVKRNEEHIAMGELIRFGSFESEGKVTLGAASAGQISLNGFNSATFNTGSKKVSYLYVLSGDKLTLTDSSSGKTVGTMKLVTKEINGVKLNGYVYLDSSLAHEYVCGDKKFTADGGMEATYSDGNNTYDGYYLVDTNKGAFGTIVRFTSFDGSVNTVLVASEKESGGTVDGEKTTVYEFSEKVLGYKELKYSNEKGQYYYPLLVLNDGADFAATVYVYLKDGSYAKAAEGTYTKTENGDYVFTKSEKIYDIPANAFTEPVDLSKVKSFAFRTEDKTFFLHYWLNYTDTENNNVSFESKKVIYRPAGNGSGSLYTYGGFAFYTADKNAEGKSFVGVYRTENGITTVSTVEKEVYYFRLDDAAGTFLKLDFAPYKAFERKADNTANSNVYLAFDGKNGAALTTTETVDNGGKKETKIVSEIEGVVSEEGKTSVSETVIYKFTSESKTFRFVILYSSNKAFFTEYAGNGKDVYFVGKDGADGTLTLDGYGFKAIYRDRGGVDHKDCAYTIKDDVITLTIDENKRYFDVVSDDGVTLRGEEYGTYLFTENNGWNGVFADFDGYGLLRVYTKVQKLNEEGKPEKDKDGNYVYIDKVIDGKGVYALSDDGKTYTYSYKKGADTVSGEGKFGYYVISGKTYRSFSTVCYDVVSTYVITDNWSVIVFDETGNATIYGQTGVKESGRYTIINEEYLYYYNNALTDSCIYKYNTAEGKMTRVDYQDVSFFTKDLESLRFSSHGFAIFNGETTYYYSILEEAKVINGTQCEAGDVIVYRYDPENAAANKYGFVSEKICNESNFTSEQPDGTIIYEDKNYYYSDGWSVTFGRKDNSDEFTVYPATGNTRVTIKSLTFVPYGSAEFNVKGTVALSDGKESSCVVTRAALKDESGNVTGYETYVTVGYYRFDVTLDYDGENSANSNYTVNACRFSRTIPSYAYMELYYLMYVYFGVGTPNQFGTITIETVYNADNSVKSDLISGDFGIYAGLTDIKGNVIFSAEKTTYEKGSVYTFAVTPKESDENTKKEDAFEYRLHISFDTHKAFGTLGYKIIAFTRVQTLTSADGAYELEIERVVYSDYSNRFGAGSVYTYSLYGISGGEKTAIEFTQAAIINGVPTGIIRVKKTVGDKEIYDSATYYKIGLEENDDAYVKEKLDSDGNPVTDENGNVQTIKGVASYKDGFSVEIINASTYYASDGGGQFVDVDEAKNSILLFYADKTYYVVTKCEYDSEKGVYTMEAAGNSYVVTLNKTDKTATIRLVTE